MREGYLPERGDLIWLTFQPQAGHEQAGRRPALVLSPAAYNGRVSLAVVCPITRSVKGYPFEVALPDGCGVTGVVLADQVKSLDWHARDAALITHLPDETTQEVLTKLSLLFLA